MNEENRNMLIFFALSMAVMLGYSYFFDNNAAPSTVSNIVSEVVDKASEKIEVIKEITHKDEEIASVNNAKIENIEIKSAKLSGVICSKGVQFNNVSLNNYEESIEKSNKVSIFDNPENKNQYYAETCWKSDDKAILVPNENTRWVVGPNKVLTEKSPVTLTWDNQHGLLFEKKLSIDENYVITIEDNVRNYSGNSFALKYTANIHRDFEKKPEATSIAYEGPIGFINGKSEQISYEDVSDKKEINYKTDGGWFGFSDKYWLVAFIPSQKVSNNVSYSGDAKGTSFSIACDSGVTSITPYAEVKKTNYLYLGAKEINTLDMYEKKLGIKHFDLAIDFGWMYILTKPFLYLLAFAKDLVGNMGLGILLITLLLKLLLFPLANKSYRSMNKMREIQPKMKELQERYANDKMKFSQEMAAIYKKEGISPMGGCLPMLLQWPILFALYKVLYISIEMRQAPFFGWIHDLSQADSMYILNLGGIIPIDLPGILQIGIWPLLMGLTMLWQQKLTPTSPDPAQEKMMLLMPIMFTVMFASMPSGLIIYWTFSNILNIVQQSLLMKIDAKQKKNQLDKKAKKEVKE